MGRFGWMRDLGAGTLAGCLALVLLASCSSTSSSGRKSKEGETCGKTADCEAGLRCFAQTCAKDSGQQDSGTKDKDKGAVDVGVADGSPTDADPTPDAASPDVTPGDAAPVDAALPDIALPDIALPDMHIPKWSVMSNPTSDGLVGVWGTDDNNIIAVGSSGRILHFNGAVWSVKSSGVTTPLTGIWGSNATNAYAVGHMNSGVLPHIQTLLRYDGAMWKPVSTGTASMNLSGIHGTSPDDIWISAEGARVLHYDGSTWSILQTTAPLWLAAMHSFSSTDVWAVGYQGAILHYNGSTWAPHTSPATNNVYGVWGTTSNNVYAVGGVGVYHYDGSQWTQLSVSTGGGTSIWGTNSSDIFIVAAAGKIAHYDGTGWTNENSGTTEHLYGVWTAPSGTAYAVGNAGTILVRK